MSTPNEQPPQSSPTAPPDWAEAAAFEWLVIAHQSYTVALANRAGLAAIIRKHAPAPVAAGEARPTMPWLTIAQRKHIESQLTPPEDRP